MGLRPQDHGEGKTQRQHVLVQIVQSGNQDACKHSEQRAGDPDCLSRERDGNRNLGPSARYNARKWKGLCAHLLTMGEESPPPKKKAPDDAQKEKSQLKHMLSPGAVEPCHAVSAKQTLSCSPNLSSIPIP